jgi:thiopeptide-type bacteriocin biosynthesis protein
LFLAPARTPRGAPDGTDWLLGLHAPAGATWGRFAAALGAPMSRALTTLADAERAARPTQETLDVAFAPSAALADLCTHPCTRARVLALSTWSDDAAKIELAPRDLELVAEPGAAAPLALREGRTGAPVTPSPLARVRSTTAPAGVPRLLGGWSLHRQHAPWALPLGPLSSLAHVPRFVLEGFVIAPASWRLPTSTTRTAFRRWRRALRVPRWVQVGHEDQLLPVDLDAPRALRELAGHERVWEIWPPLGRTLDRGGRRVEAVVALVDAPDAEEAAAAARADRATASARRVPPPRAAGPARGWRTLKLFGAPEHQDALLHDVVAPTIAAATRARELTGWFFQRYVEGPGPRHHLRVRVRAPRAAAFEARLGRALAPARAAGAVVSVDATEYHPERARFGDALEAVHDVFQSDSALVCALLDEDRVTALVRSLDALARGLGLDLPARRLLARARRDAEAGDLDAGTLDAEFRARSRGLRAALGDTDARGDGAARALRAHVARTTRATKTLRPGARAALAPALLHLASVRLGGPDRALEHRAYTFWERTLEGLARAPLAAPARTRRA